MDDVSLDMIARWLSQVDDPHKSEDAWRGIRSLSSKNKAAVPMLISKLSDKSCRIAATYCLTRIGTAAESATLPLIAELERADEDFHLVVVRTLGLISRPDKDLLIRLQSIIDAEPSDTRLRVTAAGSLLILAPTVELADHLTKCAQSGYVEKAYPAEFALHAAAVRHPSLLPCLIQLFDSWFEDVIEDAARALVRNHDLTHTLPLLYSALKEGRSTIPAGALLAFCYLGENGRPFASEIEHAMFDAEVFGAKDLHVRRRAANVCKEIPLASSSIVRVLQTMLCDEDEWVREQVAEALFSIQGDPSP